MTHSPHAIIEPNVSIDPTATIHPFAVIYGHSSVGADSEIEPHAFVEDSTIGDDCIIRHAAIIRSTTMGQGCRFGAEIKRSSFGDNVKAQHKNQGLTDIICGSNVNFGGNFGYANYDGIRKSKLHIGNNVFIGSNVLIIGNFKDDTPRSIGHNVYIAAGITLRHDVPAHHTVYPAAVAKKKFADKIVYTNDDYAILAHDKIATDGLLHNHYVQ